MRTASKLTRTIASHDPSLAGHATRVTALAIRLAHALGAAESRLTALRVGGPLHDIGKLAVDPVILAKPSALDAAELAEIRKHPLTGVQMLEGLEEARDAIDCVLHHHERWDGHGYPHRLGGNEIPFEARILAVADAYDAMTSDRPYRSALGHVEAVAEVERCAGTQFDPRVAEIFLTLA